MSEEKKSKEIKDEELSKAVGGKRLGQTTRRLNEEDRLEPINPDTGPEPSVGDVTPLPDPDGTLGG